MINHRQIEAFNALMVMGSTVKAGELLGISQPAVSRLIKQLEIETQLKLFDRESGRMRPTREGLAFHREVDRAFLSLRRLEFVAHEIRTYDQGQIRIGALPALGFSFIPQVVHKYSQENPKVLIKIETTSSAIIRDVVAGGQFDLGFVADEVDISGVLSERFAAPPVVCIMPLGHPLSRKSVIRPEDLEGEPFVSLSHVDRTRQRIDALFEKAGILPNVVVETHFALSICQLVASGLGVGLINPYSLGGIAPGQLVARPFVPRLSFQTLMIYPPDRRMSSAVQAFRNIAHREIVQSLEQIFATYDVTPDAESRKAIGRIAPPGPWIRNPRV
ncbi:LysR substrate-binding domain-containing protein [Celeribacter indicus]|uniref:LysR family transcriptional regulator n=1 Tax=Celeribacter indicus TaxID=1208324 RepID=A0A0B5E596_9RHOB|nr:LysR substrate-binding domain-containing protein [Celeribacter indicus]AJE47532.1 LysR family transcriptional regulator [Celeribacter indicus]SDW09426.1 transcriptional regulator, LysR family [Celeribacter indicus]